MRAGIQVTLRALADTGVVAGAGALPVKPPNALVATAGEELEDAA